MNFLSNIFTKNHQSETRKSLSALTIFNPRSKLSALPFSILHFQFSILVIFTSCGVPPNPSPRFPLQVVAQETYLNKAAGVKGEALETLKKGQQIYFLDSLSDRYDALMINEVLRECPWMYVETEHGTRGWAYAGALTFDSVAQQDLLKLLERHQVEHFFGNALLNDIQIFNKQLASVGTDDDFEKAWSQSKFLQARLDKFAKEKLLTYPTGQLPDWFWVSDSLKGLVIQVASSGKGFRFVRDFRPWVVAAKQTPGDADDLMLAPFFLAFPEDSMEYDIPAWQILPAENQPESLLGRGIHSNILFAINSALLASHRYERDLILLKRQLLEDITTAPRYWAALPDILKEINAIMSTPNAALDDKDLLQLAVRKGLIEQHTKNGIHVNGFGGE